MWKQQTVYLVGWDKSLKKTSPRSSWVAPLSLPSLSLSLYLHTPPSVCECVYEWVNVCMNG